MLTSIGGKGSFSVPGGCMGAEDQVEDGVKISRPGCDGL